MCVAGNSRESDSSDCTCGSKFIEAGRPSWSYWLYTAPRRTWVRKKTKTNKEEADI